MAVKTARQELMRWLMVVLILLVIGGFGASIFGVVLVQLVHGEEYRAVAENNQLRDTVISAERGVIYDCNMKVLAKSASAYKIYVKPNLIGNDENVRKRIVERLAEILDMTRKR
jgi:stage V sporulation protein D (sporulation-specific penicillin-binding protein)